MKNKTKELLRKRRFEKVVEDQYPDGERFDANIILFFFLIFIFYILHIITSPFTFKKSVFCGRRKVYFQEIN